MTDAAAVYQAQILDHYKHPRNKGVLDGATHRATEHNPLCGDKISLFLRVDGRERIEAATFDGVGCAISQASASMLTGLLAGKTVSEARALEERAVLKAVGVPLSAVRQKCALLSLQVLRKALNPAKGA